MIEIGYGDRKDKIKKNKNMIGISGKGSHGRRSKFGINDIKKVSFERGEEKEAIKLFVDINRDIIMSNREFRFKDRFYPQFLYKYFIIYLYEGKLGDVPKIHEYSFIKTKDERGNNFCQYLRKRSSKLLKDPNSLLHNCAFLNETAEKLDKNKNR